MTKVCLSEDHYDLQKIIIISAALLCRPLSVDPTIDAIYQIILDEEQNDPSLIRKDFAVNITGGTNAMGAAALLS
jgi:hypothetical protein